MKNIKRICECIISLFFIIILYLLIQGFVYKNAVVSGDSMRPTLENNDKILINRFIYNFRKPDYNDIIIFPVEEYKKEFYIKRIIGLPNDKIDLKEGKIYVNDKELEDDFTYNKVILLGNLDYPVIVPEDSYFILGDNRNDSDDSRNSEIGYIKRTDIIGKVALRIWPIEKFGLID